MTNISCKDCAFFQRFQAAERNDGHCHRFPPTVTADVGGDLSMRDGDGGGDISSTLQTSYPYVDHTDWCGEYKWNQVDQ